MILTKIFDRIMDLRGEFEVLEFRIGKRKTDYSYARLTVKGKDEQHLQYLLKEMFRLGATVPKVRDAELAVAQKDGVLPNGFCSTTNHPTEVFVNGRWVKVEDPSMDKAIVVDPDGRRAFCKPLREVKKGDMVVIGESGVRIKPPERPRESMGIFGFMVSEVSSEKPSLAIVRQVVESVYSAKREGRKIVVVAGPAVVHTGAAPSLAKIIKLGYVDALLSGNALAVHDVEYALLGTSLGLKIDDASMTVRESRNHLAAINEVLRAGSLKGLVNEGVLTKGIFYECIVKGVPFVLAGSIRDDGPLPEVITDSVEAQKRYKDMLKDADLVIMLATALHSIAVGNLLPSTVKIICVDINPAVATKLLDRGTAQAVGIVSDIGVFFPLVAEELEERSV